MDSQIFTNELVLYAGTLLVGVAIFAFIFTVFFAVVAVVALIQGAGVLAGATGSLAKQAWTTRSAQSLRVPGAERGVPAPVLSPAVREKLNQGLSAARTHAGSAAVGLAGQASAAAKASRSAVAAKWADLSTGHEARSRNDSDKAA